MKTTLSRVITLPITILAAFTGLIGCSKKLSTEEVQAIYNEGLPPPKSMLKVYHLGHSLVGKDMPYMLEQLAGEGHRYHSQLGWGATLKSHWEPDVPVNGFESENFPPAYRDVVEAIESQEYDAFVLTEMVEIRAAIKYFDSAKYLSKFSEKIHQDSPDTRIYFYETWHEVNDPEGWINRLDNDLPRYWEQEILYKSLAKLDGEVTIYMIPAGQVLSRFFKEVEKIGGVGEIKAAEDIFATTDEGKLDPIHINDIGSYFIALIHYAVLYQKSPEGLPFQLKKRDGSAAVAPSAEVAALMQKITWEVVKDFPKTGIR
jgi:hypothetical protein